MIQDWLSNGVQLSQFMRPFRGNFRGSAYSSPLPPPTLFENAATCAAWEDFISRTLEEWITRGAIDLVGRVGQVNPPHLVMPLTVEPSKPRLCHDERFLNLWVRDNPFTLETLNDVPRLVETGDFLTSCDHKAGYQHVRIHPNSQKYFGIQWDGWYLVYTTLPFGFKASTFIYQTLSDAVTGYTRKLGVAGMTYIDDSLNGLWRPQNAEKTPAEKSARLKQAKQAVYIVCEVLTRLGYTLALSKSVLIPVQRVLFLGMLVDAAIGAFLLPGNKKLSFALLRESILDRRVISIRMLQRLHGKCISFMPAIPAAKLYTCEMARALSKAARSSKPVTITEQLRKEVSHWRFVDSWDQAMVWRDERHLHFRLATDSSGYKWGAFILGNSDKSLEMGDFWPSGDQRPIHVKEAHALLNALRALKNRIANHRVDVSIDSQAVIGAWEGQGSRDTALADILKEIFQLLFEANAQLKLQFVASDSNPADAPSRSLSKQDCTLSHNAWQKVQEAFGPHSIDLMATDSNCRQDQWGKPLRHFTPFPTPLSDGVNLFAQTLGQEENPYCFPPICLIAPAIAFLAKSGVTGCTVVTPLWKPWPLWAVAANRYCKQRILLAKKGDTDTLLWPSRSGYISDQRGLPWDLWAMRLSFPKPESSPNSS